MMESHLLFPDFLQHPGLPGSMYLRPVPRWWAPWYRVPCSNTIPWFKMTTGWDRDKALRVLQIGAIAWVGNLLGRDVTN